MTPDEALRHEWILSGTSGYQKSGNDLRHSHSEVHVGHDSHSSSSTSGSSHSRIYHKTVLHAPRGDKVKAKILDTRIHDSIGKLDSNLNDSGTFLPPIL